MNARRWRMHDKLAALPGVRPVRRPLRRGADERFDLYYVRAGRKSTHPLLLIPGGPGAASVALYRGFRRRAAATGLDVIMVEHRGVGLSRHDASGADIPPEDITIDSVVDDIAAALDIVDALYAGRAGGLPARAATLDSRPPGLGIRALRCGLAAATAMESALPVVVPRTAHRVTS